MNPKTSKAKKIVFIILGTISLGLAYLGVALPGVPGIPFILLTGFFYVRSSDRLYAWLMRNKLFGRMLREFHQHQTVPLKFKIFVISQLWVSITVALIWFVETLWLRVLIISAGIIVSIVVAMLKETKYIASEVHDEESDPKTNNDPESPLPHKKTL